MALLEILVPSIPDRWRTCYDLISQVNSLNDPDITVRPLVTPPEKEGGPSTGAKRNELVETSEADYIWFVDDDDELILDGVREVLKGCRTGVDVIGINGYMTTNGANRVNWEIRLGHPYAAAKRDGKLIYLRHPNHITPIRREAVKHIKFPEVSWQEDKAWCDLVKEADVLKTEYVVDQDVYHYKFSTNDKSYATNQQ